MMLRLILIAVVDVSTCAAALAQPLRGDKVSPTQSIIGCKSLDDENRFVELMGGGDRKAALAFLDEKPGQCAVIDPADTATVEDVSVWNAKTCVRPTGNPHCFWAPTNAFGK